MRDEIPTRIRRGPARWKKRRRSKRYRRQSLPAAPAQPLPLEFVFVLALCIFAAVADAADSASGEEWKPRVDDESQSHLFSVSSHVRVLGPTRFPKPTKMVLQNKGGDGDGDGDGDDSREEEPVPVVDPAFGRHRPSRDAVFAYAEGYSLGVYMMFVETLKSTGFKGDVVLAIAEERILQPRVEGYLRHHALPPGDGGAEDEDEDRLAVVVYQIPLFCSSSDGDESGERKVMKKGFTDVFQMCQLHGVYGWKDPKTGEVVETAKDPRQGRPVATVRYELYWIWALRYEPSSWIMLLDARDSFFQTDPFAKLPRDDDSGGDGANEKTDGLLYFFGENPDSTRLGKSKKNLQWLRNGYGEAVLDALKMKPTICSGSTMGEQVALESYLRALVNEHDECNIRMTGSDQGFHNYLYWSGKLLNDEAIRKIIVWEQGRGVINNLGAMRTKKLEEWGIYNPDTHQVYQWDGKTLSPVVHQWDRDAHLHSYMAKKRQKQWEKEWAEQHPDVADEKR